MDKVADAWQILSNLASIKINRPVANKPIKDTHGIFHHNTIKSTEKGGLY